MTSNGGASLAVGIWYQSLGAVAATIHPWKFTGTPGNINGKELIKGNDYSLLVEYFDMDAAIFSSKEILLIQFKVTSQQQPKGFGLTEVKEIFQNAAQAILNHQKRSSKPITKFIVATNRPKGNIFKKIEAILEDLESKKAETNYQELLANSSVPNNFFPKKKKAEEAANDDSDDSDSADDSGDDSSDPRRTLRDFIEIVVLENKAKWGFTKEQCFEACLLTIRCFKFATADPPVVLAGIKTWLKRWGLLAEEHNNYCNHLLGQIQHIALVGDETDKLNLMRGVLDSTQAVPISPEEIWFEVIKLIKDRNEPDPPTDHFFNEGGFADWMLDRSILLKKIFDTYSDFSFDPPDSESAASASVEGESQIYAFVGPGGVGKTGLIARFIFEIASRIWDWKEKRINTRERFLGYPLFLTATPDFLMEIEGAIKRWGKRSTAFDNPIERLKVAGGVKENAPAVWIALDGIDELNDDQLAPLARSVSTCVQTFPNVRIVLSSRPDQFNYLKLYLKNSNLAPAIRVDEFDQDESYEALSQATEGEFSSDSPSALSIGTRASTASAISNNVSPDFEACIKQPLFIGVIHNLYKSGEINVIQEAYNGDPAAMLRISTEYIYVFCERVYRRLRIPKVKPKHIFGAIKRLASKVDNPVQATMDSWEEICRTELEGHIRWGDFYDQCDSSGLITKIKGGAFEWRLLFIGEGLKSMEENPKWTT